MQEVQTGERQARVVPQNERMSILPKYIGKTVWLALLESTIFDRMQKMCEAYSGGMWEMVETGTGAFFMWPQMEAKERGGLLLMRSENGSEELVSVEAGGLVASLFGMNIMCWSTRSDEHIALFQRLMDFARLHPEWKQIQALID